MSPVPLSKIKIESKVAIIRAALVELAKFSTLTQKEFTKEKEIITNLLFALILGTERFKINNK